MFGLSSASLSNTGFIFQITTLPESPPVEQQFQNNQHIPHQSNATHPPHIYSLYSIYLGLRWQTSGHPDGCRRKKSELLRKHNNKTHHSIDHHQVYIIINPAATENPASPACRALKNPPGKVISRSALTIVGNPVGLDEPHISAGRGAARAGLSRRVR